MSEATATVSPRDGRRGPRSERRTQAIDAFIDLILERGVHPRPEEVAERAGVSMASLYRYFTNLDELRHDAVARLVQRFPDLFDISPLSNGNRSERIAAFVAARVALHETLHPLELLPASMAVGDPSAAARVDEHRLAFARQVRQHFAPEISGLTPAQADDVVTTIAALTSVEAWEHFRRTHGRSQAQTRRAWTNALEQLVPSPSA